jgi:MFS family permease
MAAVGAYIRLGIDESPIHKAELEKREDGSVDAEEARWPILQVLQERPGRVLLGIFSYAGPFMAYSVATTMLVSYASSPDQAAAHGFDAVSKGSLMNAMMIGTAGMLITAPFFAHLSDKIGRRPVFVTSALLTVIHVFAMFPLVTSGHFGLAVLSYFISMTILNASAMALVPALLAELFPTKTRYTGVSLTYQIGSTLGGGLGPMIAATLIVPSGPGAVAVSAMIAGLCVVAAICGTVLGDTRKVDLRNA